MSSSSRGPFHVREESCSNGLAGAWAVKSDFIDCILSTEVLGSDF